jgi:hypothetical protein
MGGKWTQKQIGKAGRMITTTKTTFACDAKGRHVWNTVTSSGTSCVTQNFLYDGWNPVAILNPRSFRLAHQLQVETTITLSWIAKQLHMGAIGSLSNLLRHHMKRPSNMRMCGTDPFMNDKNTNE